jgi:type VI secretion system protein ImpH
MSDLASRATQLSFLPLLVALAREERGVKVRFRHHASFGHPGGDVHAARELVRRGERTLEVETTFLGLIGAVSPLANAYSEEVLHAEDEGLRAFYDVLHHRIIELAGRAVLRAMPAALARDDGKDAFTRRALSLSGAASKRAPAALERSALAASARLFGTRPRTRDALALALQLAFPGYPFRVEDGATRSVEVDDPPRLGRGARLSSTPLGGRFVRQGGFVRIFCGPLERPQFEALVPGGPLHARLRAVVREALGGARDAELVAEVRPGDEPVGRIGDAGAGESRLGAGALLGRFRESPPLRFRVPLSARGGRPEVSRVRAA